MTQKEKILKLIIDSGKNGISTNELRNTTHAVDVPKCVSDLNKEGHGITSIENGDGTVTYYIEYQPVRTWEMTPGGTYTWVYKGIQKVQVKPRKKKSHIDFDWRNAKWIDPMTGQQVDIAL